MMIVGETSEGTPKAVLVDDLGRVFLAGIGSETNIDKFNRLRVSTGEGNRFDYDPVYGLLPELVDEVSTGNATNTFDSDSRDSLLEIVETNSGTGFGLYGYDVPYTAGSSQIIDITGTLNDAGLTGGTTELFVRSKVTGSVVETTYAQADWDDSVLDVDWSKSQILVMDFQSLRVGSIGFALARSGVIVPVLQVNNDNLRAIGYWQTPNLPPYWRIYNDATYTYAEMGYGDTDNAIGVRYTVAANASASMRAICATVKSEAAYNLFDIPGFNRAADRGVTTKTVSTTLVPIFSIRVAATFNSIANRGLYIPNGYTMETDNAIRFVILYRPTLTGASFAAVDAANSGMEADTAATAVSGGIVVDSGYFSTTKNHKTDKVGVLGRTIMHLTRTATSDILTIAGIRTGSSDADVLAGIEWREIR